MRLHVSRVNVTADYALSKIPPSLSLSLVLASCNFLVVAFDTYVSVSIPRAIFSIVERDFRLIRSKCGEKLARRGKDRGALGSEGRRPSCETPGPPAWYISLGIIFAINRDRKIGKRYRGGGGDSRKELRRIVSLICFQMQLRFLSLFLPSFPSIYFPLSPHLSNSSTTLRGFVSTATLATMEIHLTWTINRP